MTRFGALIWLLLGSVSLASITACGLKPDPSPQIPVTAYGGTGDLMAKCMQYASESYCEQQVWGGGPR